MKYLDYGYWTPFNSCFDIGNTTRKAIENYRRGMEPNKCGGNLEEDNGNGALMRISPLVPLLYVLDPTGENDNSNFKYVKYKINIIKKFCEVTHSHPRSILACIIYIEFLLELCQNTKPIKELLNQKPVHKKDKIIAYKKMRKSIKNFLNSPEILGNLNFKNEVKHFDRILKKKIYKYNRNDIYSTGYVVHSLEASIWSCINYDSYREIVLNAINLGEDTDTIGFICGSMAGILYDIPKKWILQIKDIRKIEEKFEEFKDRIEEIKYNNIF